MLITADPIAFGNSFGPVGEPTVCLPVLKWSLFLVALTFFLLEDLNFRLNATHPLSLNYDRTRAMQAFVNEYSTVFFYLY